MPTHRLSILCLSAFLLCLTTACEKSPALENPQATSYKNSLNNLGIYNFTFNFINAGSQSIEIESVAAYDSNQQELTHDPEFIVSLGSIPAEILTHHIPNSTFPLKDFAKRFRVDLSAIPLLSANAIITPGNSEPKNPYSDAKFEITPQNKIIQGKQKIIPARYTVLTGKPYDKVTLKIQYKVNGAVKALIQQFDTIEQKMK